jgi:uncharacterized protein YhjY with autotransporter beta-barrel domain
MKTILVALLVVVLPFSAEAQLVTATFNESLDIPFYNNSGPRVVAATNQALPFTLTAANQVSNPGGYGNMLNATLSPSGLITLQGDGVNGYQTITLTFSGITGQRVTGINLLTQNAVQPNTGVPLLTYSVSGGNQATISFVDSTLSSGGFFAITTGISTFQLVLSPAFFQIAGLTPNQQAVVGSLNGGLIAGNANANFGTLVNDLVTQPNLGSALSQLSPQQFGQFTSMTAFNNASFETEAQDTYAASRRMGANGTFVGGNGHVDASGLTMNDPSYDPGLAMVHSRLLAWTPGPFNGEISDVASPVLGGVDMKDTKEMTAMAPAYSDPWNFFVRGNVILAQGFSQADVAHFDDNTESVVLGTDYRISPNFLIGLTAGYGHTDVTLDDNGSSATVDSYSPGLYASYAEKGWYANFSGNYTHNAYTQSRVIGFLGQTADSAPEGNQGTANIDGGYDFHCGALTYGPLAGVQYTHLSVDGYNESGSIADLSVNGQDSDSLRSRLGGRISYAFAQYGMTFTPHLDASWQHEFLDQSRGITSQFSGTGLGSFSVRTTNPSRDSALADVGLDADVNRTLTLFTDYEVQAGQSNYFGQSVQGGVRIGF